MSDYKLYMSNHLNSFIGEYSSLLQSRSLFDDKLYIVVQNKSIGEWLKLELASHCGISANLNIILPENAVRLFVRFFESGRNLLASSNREGERAVLFMDNLKIIIYKKLEELLHTERRDVDFQASQYKSLEKYVKGLSSEESDYEAINSLRLYQLSDSIAGLFYYYGMNCRKLTANWEKGIPFFPSQDDQSIRTHELWQMALWNELFKENSPYVHLSSILTSIIESHDVYDGDPARIVLFGSAFMGDSSLRFFNHLSNYITVDHFILSPSFPTESYKMPLLKNWGSLFEGFNHLIKSFSTTDSGTQLNRGFVENSRGTVLGEIQNRLLNDSLHSEPFIVSHSDESLKIISTSSKWREVEALKNRILKLLDEDSSLKLTDIGVLAPDINEYSHFIEAVFPAEDNTDLPYNIIDLKGDEDSPFISGFTDLLNLAGARFTRKEMFSLFANRCFAEKNGISSATYDTWLELCDRVNIKWSIDEEHKKELHLHGDRYNSWESGFDRILEGIALSEEEDPLSAPYELFNESANNSAGKLIHVVRSLHLDINSLTGAKLQLEEWILIWESIMETYLKPSENHSSDTSDRLRLKGCFRDILNMVNDLNNLRDLKNRSFDFFMFKSLMTEFINKSGGSRGRYLTQGISCSSLKPLRAVPFKFIMVMGMNE
ncbi:MAG: exodeoxyribonuclease V subunit gamma, partial [Spirochaetaceae bacterium]|nr:exodeoxyribonuclease V subunit gamma [Spirochaetaceae bacterium]